MRPKCQDFLNEIDEDKNTYLHFAVKYYDQGLFDILLLKFIEFKKQININSQDKDGNSVLHLACASGLRNCVKNLLEKGATYIVKN